MNGFINRISAACGGSRVLAWLLTVTVATGVICILFSSIEATARNVVPAINAWLALPAEPLRAATRIWTAVTYMTVHYSVWHLLFNTLWLYWFGRILLDLLTGRRLLHLFIGSGVTGAVFYVAASTLGGAPAGACLTGDSAAVLGLMAAAGIMMPRLELRLFLFGSVRLCWVAAVCILLTFIGSSGSGLAAHFGGVIYGAVAALTAKGIIPAIPMPTSKRNRKRHNPRRAARAMSRLSDHDRLDQLLDKIRLSGYDSLSAREKTELDHISSRIKENPESH